MKVCVVLPRFSISGVPLAQIRFAEAFSRAGHQVDLIVGYADPSLTMPAVRDVTVTVQNQPKVRGMLMPLMRYLRDAKPDLVFSAEDHLNAVVYLAAILTRSRAKISGSSRVTPFDTYSAKPFTKRWLLKQFVRAVSWRADALTCVSEDMVDQYRQVFGTTRHIAVYNIVEDANTRRRLSESIDDPWIASPGAPMLCAAGSLVPWKGFGDLIAAVRLLRDRGRDVRLLILGEGPLRPVLQAQIDELDLADRVRLTGHVDNPLKYFARSDAFVLSSLVEGLPNVLVEAMLAGCTPVSTDCPTGPREVLKDGEYGYLVAMADPAALADGIERALDYPIDCAKLSAATAPFREDAVLRKHLDALGVAA